MPFFYFVVPVWGADFIELFLRYALPSHLSPGNLGALSQHPSDAHRYFIYVDSHSAKTIEAHPLFQKLKQSLKTEIVFIDEIMTEKKGTFQIELECHSRVIAAAEDQGAGVVILNPDAIWSDGSFEKLFRLVQEGKRAVGIASVRANREDLPALRPNNHGGFESRDLVGWMMKSLHPAAKGVCAGAPKFSEWAGHNYWEVEDEGIFARNFFPHMMYVQSKYVGIRPQVSYDYDWIEKAIPDFEDHHIVQDSDDVFCISIMSKDQKEWHPRLENKSRFLTLVVRARWAKKSLRSFHYRYFQKPVCIHAGEMTPHRWDRVSHRADSDSRRLIWLTQNHQRLFVRAFLLVLRASTDPLYLLDLIPIRLNLGLRKKLDLFTHRKQLTS